MAEWIYDEKYQFYPLTQGPLAGQSDLAEGLRQLGYVTGAPPGSSRLGQLWWNTTPGIQFPYCVLMTMPTGQSVVWLRSETTCWQWMRRYAEVAAINP